VKDESIETTFNFRLLTFDWFSHGGVDFIPPLFEQHLHFFHIQIFVEMEITLQHGRFIARSKAHHMFDGE